MKNANYNNVGMYFITICTLERKCILSKITDEYCVELSPYGKTAEKYINQLNDFYDNIDVESYVIMPNHIHFILFIKQEKKGPSRTPVPTGTNPDAGCENGVYTNSECGLLAVQRPPVPTTVQNSAVSRFVSTFKRFCNKEYGKNIWQSRSYDHIVRNVQDYDEHIKYIYENPMKWYYDELYTE